MTATISVVIPVFNGERYLSAALDSAGAQSRPPLEIIVVDDGSTDGTAAILAARPDVRVLRQPNQGPAAARNRGLGVAVGDYVAMLDADDLWPPDRLDVLGAVLDNDPAVGVVWGTQQLLIEPGAPMPDWVPPGDPATLSPTELPRPTGAFMARRAAFDAVGGYDPDLRHGEDSDWALRVKDLGIGWAMIDDVVLTRRLHEHNLTLDSNAQRRAMFAVLQRRAARRRAP